MADVVLISGSPRANGNTEYLLNVCKEAIESAGLTAKVLTLRGKPIQSCIACGQCGKLGKCALNDGLNEMLPEIREARVGMVSRANGGWMSGKVGGPVVVARRGGQTATLQEMLMMYFICGMTVPGSTYWNIAFGQAPGTVAEDEEGVATMRTFAENVAFLIQKIRG